MGTISLAPPSDGPVTQWYANEQPDGNLHAGQDWAYYDDGVIYPDAYAMDAGEVVWAGDSRELGWPNFLYINPDFDRSDGVDSSGGNVVALRHWYGITSYGHLESIDVVVGQQVAKRQRLGTVGTSGFSSGKHLHADLILDPVDFNTPTYGRANLNLYMEWEELDDMTPHDLLIAPAYTGGPQVSEILKMVHQVYLGMFKGGDSTPYKASLFNLVDDMARRAGIAVANYPVKRDGKVLPWVQDTANGTTALDTLQDHVLPALAEQLKLDPQVIRDAFLEAVGKVSVTMEFGDDDHAGPSALAIDAPAVPADLEDLGEAA